MRRRTFEEMITYFNQTVSEMDIDRKYKMTLLGIVTALLQKHDEELAKNSPKVNSDSGELISRQAAYETLTEYYHHTTEIQHKALREALERVPDSQPELIEREAYIRGFKQGKTQGRLDTLSAQPERLTDDDFETIRIHLNAYKEKLCNQHRWEEANEYQRIIDRFMAFASAQPEPCEDTISRKAAIDSICRTVCDNPDICESPCDEIKVLEIMPSAQPETHGKRTETHGVCLDTIDRQAAIDALNVGAELLRRVLDDADIVGAERAKYEWGLGLIESYISDMKELPSEQPDSKELSSTHKALDTISRQEAIDHLKKRLYETALNNMSGDDELYSEIADNRIHVGVNEIPSAQPERLTDERSD